jgi:gliding motility-associated-like protein
LKQALYTLLFIFSFSPVDAHLSVLLNIVNQKCEKGSASIQIVSAHKLSSINWSTGASGVLSVSDLIAGDYYVTVKDSAQDTTINFKIEKGECPVIIRNHFTPNGDNFNDTWGIYMTEYHPRLKLYVYNKWGQLVHTQSGSYIPWDGTQNGVPVADGTYYYVFYYEANVEYNYVKGDVTILR